uniref:Uncharacterized protein n=1 Tax=Biomphalaria glabrata TaxID=6526 RepID=A0A2C9M4P1_BIOGL
MASNDANLKNSRFLTASEVTEIYYLSKKQEILAKDLLAKKLGIAPVYDKNDTQKPLFIDYIFDNIKFSAEKGFPWQHISIVVKFAHEFLKRILVENHKLGDALLDLKSLSHLLEPLSDHHQKQYLDFIYDTVLTHYNLYKYVFSTPRELNHPKIHRLVKIPPKPFPLGYAKEKAVYEYDEKIKALDKLEAQTIMQLKENLLSKDAFSSHKTVSQIDGVPLPYSKMSLEELLKDVLSGVMEIKGNEFLFNANEAVEELSFKFEKAIVPRPVVLGSPPRYELKNDPRATTSSKSRKSIMLSNSTNK